MRSLDGRMLPFKKGPFFLAMDSGAPCIPISIYGTEKIIPWGSRRIYPGTAHIVFHEPVNPADYATPRRTGGSCARGHRLGPAGMDARLNSFMPDKLADSLRRACCRLADLRLATLLHG